MKPDLYKLKNKRSDINWFNNIKNKQKLRLTKIDVKDFYPSISSNTLLEALALAKNNYEISKVEIDTIVYCCKQVIINNSCAWSKKDMGDGFGIPQIIFHGA